MGVVSVRRADGSTFELRTSKATRRIRVTAERPTRIDFSNAGDLKGITELTLSDETALRDFDLAPLAHMPKLTSLVIHVAKAVDLRPLAKLRLQSLTINVGGKDVLDFRPLKGHPTLNDVALGFTGTQAKLDLAFVRTLPALQSLAIDGGNWKALDLRPLRGLPLTAFVLYRQYVSQIDLELLAQPALEHLTLAELDVNERFMSLWPLAKCVKLRSLNLSDLEIATLDVSAIANLSKLKRFDPPNGVLTRRPGPLTAPGLKRWAASIGVE